MAGPDLSSSQEGRVLPSDTLQARTGLDVSNNWHISSLSTNSLNAIAMAGPSDGWIVGDGGSTFHYDGSIWQRISSNDSHNLNSVYVVPDTGQAWAVGDYGTILHFVNGAWAREPSPYRGQLDAVWMTSTDDGWIVGASGTILHYQAKTWTQVQMGLTDKQFHYVQMLAANNGWAVGEGGTVLHYDGTQWQPVPCGETSALYGVWMSPAGEGWIVGDSVAGGPSTILHYANGHFTRVPAPVNTRLWFNSMTSTAEGWASGNGGTLVHLVQGAWVADTAPLTQYPLYGVWMVSPSEGWAVGWGGVLLHYQASGSPPGPLHKLYLPQVDRGL